MKEIFITNLYVQSVRHLKNLNIPLAAQQRQHLILTGRNGSGKTSFLQALKTELQRLEGSYPSFLDKTDTPIRIAFGASEAIPKDLKNKYILAFFGAKRLSEFKKPAGPQKMNLKPTYKLEEKVHSQFLQYLINLNYRKLNAIVQNQTAEAQKIEAWFVHFTESLRLLFDAPQLELIYDIENFNFEIVVPNRDKFDLNTLSDGYSAVIHILTELMLRMNQQQTQLYDNQGIVLIDEIEAHLHIDLQQKILPFLTQFFPKIQFIVTTHSPFVLTSVKNAVIYDLEKQEAIVDLTGYSVEAVIESYFNANEYSKILTAEVAVYEALMLKSQLSDMEQDRLSDLKQYFKNLPYFLAPELKLKIQQIQLAKLTQ